MCACMRVHQAHSYRRQCPPPYLQYRALPLPFLPGQQLDFTHEDSSSSQGQVSVSITSEPFLVFSATSSSSSLIAQGGQAPSNGHRVQSPPPPPSPPLPFYLRLFLQELCQLGRLLCCHPSSNPPLAAWEALLMGYAVHICMSGWFKICR